MSITEERVREIAREEFKKILDTGLMYTEQSKNAPKIQSKQSTEQKPQNPANILSQFPTELANLLTTTEENNYYILKPKKFLEPDNFAKVAEIVKTLGGEYISAGKNSHFRIKKVQNTETNPAITITPKKIRQWLNENKKSKGEKPRQTTSM